MNGADRLPVTFATQAGNRSFEQALSIATAAEAAGFTNIAFADRPHDPVLDGWTLSTAVVARTNRIRVFHATLNVPYRYPSVIAKQAATFDIVSGGRLDLCLGAGGENNRSLYEGIGVSLAAPADRITDLEDAIAIVRGLWSHDRFTYHGRIHHVDDAVGDPKPVQRPIPVWIGGIRPRSLRMAGRLADGFMKDGGFGSVEQLAEVNRQVDAAAIEAGRNPRAIRRILNGGGFVGTRREVDAYWARNEGPPKKGPAQAEGLVGTADEILDMIRAYREEAGIDLFNARFQPDEAIEQIERFGREIIPEASGL